MISLRDFINAFKIKVPDSGVIRRVENALFLLEFEKETTKEWYSRLSIHGLGVHSSFDRRGAMFYTKSGFQKPQPFVYENTWELVEILRPTSTRKMLLRIRRISQ